MKINSLDNVYINISDGHKYADRDIKKGEDIIKYGCSIGHATTDIKKGEHVHTHNLKTNLSGKISYSYDPRFYELPKYEKRTFKGYIRRELAHKVQLRTVPDLVFVLDDSQDYSANINRLLDKINKGN